MPCQDNYGFIQGVNTPQSEADKLYSAQIKHYEKLVNEQLEKIHKLDACLCAILTELEKIGIDEKIIEIASIEGKIDLSKHWKNHKIKDEVRLKTDLEKYSNHEIDVIKKIINK